MDAINTAVLAELQEYAQLYFSAIVELHTVEGKCNLKPGKYSAKELVDNLKAACGSYGLPADEIFNEDIEISIETFKCKFPYRRIFAILAQWEAMSKAGKQKAVFEIGEVEEKSAKVLLNEKTECGAFKTKSVKLQRITGNWWMPRKVKKNRPIELYYELNGIMFMPGKQVWSDNPTDPETVKWCERYNDEAMSKLLLSFLGNDREQTQKITPYYAEIANRAGIAATPAETPQNSTETAVAGNVSAKEENTAETAKYRISRFGGYKIIIGNREQGRVIAILMSVNGHNTIEISDESASIATMGEKPLQIDKPIMQLSDAEVLKLIYSSTEPPQPPEIPQRTECTIIASKPRETARKEPKRTISKKERVYYPAWSDKFARYHFARVNKMASVPILAPSGYAPPIRGDCKICIPQRAKPPNCASCEKINILQPP